MLKSVTTEKMEATFHGLELSIGLKVRVMRLASGPSTMELHPFNLVFERPGTVEVEVTQEAVAAMLERHAPKGLGGFSVLAQYGKLFVEATARLGVKVKVDAVATVEIEGHDRLVVRLEKVGSLPGPVSDLVAKQIERVNPLVTTDDWPAKVQLDTVTVDHGLVVVRGRLVSASF